MVNVEWELIHRYWGTIGILTWMIFSCACQQLPSSGDQQYLQETGKVVAIYETGEKDIVFQLDHTDIRFVIPAALDKGLNLALLRASLLNQEVTVSYPKYWTQEDPRNDDRKIVRLEYGGEKVYSGE